MMQSAHCGLSRAPSGLFLLLSNCLFLVLFLIPLPLILILIPNLFLAAAAATSSWPVKVKMVRNLHELNLDLEHIVSVGQPV